MHEHLRAVAESTDDETRWNHLREQRRELRRFSGEILIGRSDHAHPAARIAAIVARIASWLLEPVHPGPVTRARLITVCWVAGTAAVCVGVAIGSVTA